MGGVVRKTELLSPAGSFEVLKAVAEAGADAVYAAGSKFGARAYAENFTDRELEEALDYLHVRGKRLYLAVNTLLKEKELEELPGYLSPLYERGLDAVIVQDLGVLDTIRERFPDLPIHASTQMAVTGAYGAKMMLSAGCSRIVVARELSLAEISNIYQVTGAEIESFVHGSLCYCYSGMCLLSSMIGGRSGNRGRCAQPCRLLYGISGEQGKSYLLSPKDLCAIDLLPQLIESGVHSLKIEGRMKQAEYAAGATRIYRKYLDGYEADPKRPYKVSQADREYLLGLGNRCGFTDGYYTKHNGKDMITFSSPSHGKGEKGSAKAFLSEENGIEKKEKINGNLRLSQGFAARLVLEYQGTKVEVTGGIVKPAQKQPLTKETALEKLRKTGDTPFVFDKLEVELEDGAFLPIGALNQLRRDGIAALQEKILQEYRRIGKNEKEDSGTYQPHGSQEARKPGGQSHGPLAPQEEGRSQGPRLHVLTETADQFQLALKQPNVHRIYVEGLALGKGSQGLRQCVAQARDAGKECYLALPYVFRMETARRFLQHWRQIEASGASGYLARNFEELQFLKEMGVGRVRIQGDYQLYGYSSKAQEGLLRLPLSQLTLPVELNYRELKQLPCADGEWILYGYQPLMVSAQCIRKNTSGCGKGRQLTYLADRYGKQFPVKSWCQDCYNVIYNTSPLSLFHHYKDVCSLGVPAVRIAFTIEKEEEVQRVFGYYQEAVASGTVRREGYFSDFTNGHWKRGVE